MKNNRMNSRRHEAGTDDAHSMFTTRDLYALLLAVFAIIDPFSMSDMDSFTSWPFRLSSARGNQFVLRNSRRLKVSFKPVFYSTSHLPHVPPSAHSDLTSSFRPSLLKAEWLGKEGGGGNFLLTVDKGSNVRLLPLSKAFVGAGGTLKYLEHTVAEGGGSIVPQIMLKSDGGAGSEQGHTLTFASTFRDPKVGGVTTLSDKGVMSFFSFEGRLREALLRPVARGIQDETLSFKPTFSLSLVDADDSLNPSTSSCELRMKETSTAYLGPHDSRNGEEYEVVESEVERVRWNGEGVIILSTRVEGSGGCSDDDNEDFNDDFVADDFSTPGSIVEEDDGDVSSGAENFGNSSEGREKVETDNAGGSLPERRKTVESFRIYAFSTSGALIWKGDQESLAFPAYADSEKSEIASSDGTTTEGGRPGNFLQPWESFNSSIMQEGNGCLPHAVNPRSLLSGVKTELGLLLTKKNSDGDVDGEPSHAPNAVMVHSTQGILAYKLGSGAPLTRVSLPAGSLYADLDGDGIIDSIHIHTRDEGGGGVGKEHAWESWGSVRDGMVSEPAKPPCKEKRETPLQFFGNMGWWSAASFLTALTENVSLPR